jgi:hypothetical protein
MEIQVATLCDSAQDYNSKLCILGTFDTIGSRGTPVVHPQCALALRVCFRAADEGAHKMQIRMINADGKDMMQPLEANVDIRMPEGADFITRNMILNFQPLRIETGGTFSFDVFFDGKQYASVPLRVLVVEGGSEEAVA